MKKYNLSNMPPPGTFDKSPNQNWAPCFICGAKIRQIRKAKFKCDNGHDIIACEEDMRIGSRRRGLK